MATSNEDSPSSVGCANIVIGSSVEDEASAIDFANEIMATSRSNKAESSIFWKEECIQHGIRIETAAIESSTGSLTRAIIPLEGIQPDDLYRFLISKEGYVFIDPDADPDEFGKPILGPYEWEGAGKLQVEYAKMDLPFPLSKRDYVVLNGFHDASRTFLSVSCTSTAVDKQILREHKTKEDKIRMAIFGTYTALPPDKKDHPHASCVLRVEQYVDMQGWMSWASNKANVTWFQKFVERAQKEFPSQKHQSQV